MEKSHIKLALGDMSVADKIAEARRVIAGLLASGLADKADLAAKLKTATDQLEADETAAKLAASEAQAATQKRNATEADFADAMNDVAGTVERETDYNGPQMQDIGYELASTNRAPATMTKVLDVQLSSGDYPSELHAQWQPVKGSRSYEVQYLVSDTIVTDDANWRNGDIVSASKCDLEGLPSRQLAWVRVRAIGKSKGPWSDAVSMAAQ